MDTSSGNRLSVPPAPPSPISTIVERERGTTLAHDLAQWRDFLKHLAHGHPLALALHYVGATMDDWRRWKQDPDRAALEAYARGSATRAAALGVASPAIDALWPKVLATWERNLDAQHARDQLHAADSLADRMSDPRLHRTQPSAQGPGGPGVHVHLGVYVVPQAPGPAPRVIDVSPSPPGGDETP